TLSVNESFVKMKLINMAQILLLAAVISGLLFRSVVMGILVTVPLLAATVLGFAAMTVLSFPLNVATITIVAISVGIGADYAIYFGMRMRAFLSLDPDDVSGALGETYRTAGKAVLFVASAVAGGFLGLVASIGYNVHLWLGVLVSFAMFGSALASLTLFPALLILLRPAALFPRKLMSSDAVHASK
ncbi:MAG: MMPL family transporter, partial [Kiritimatiellae bacterium]|nr:MMPL family transporter [Kiritimatiellia bacterium]